jgi:hypothetical protein
MRNYLEFHVVEINISAGIRNGHLIAQQPFAAGTAAAVDAVVSNDGYIDNGFFFKLDAAGEVVVPSSGVGPMYLHYTEELLTDRQLLKDFAIAEDEYPRLVRLFEGDVFTTDNFAGTYAAQTVAYVNPATGQLTLAADVAAVQTALAEGVSSPVFAITESTLPDGSTAALEFLYIADIVGLAA